MTKPEQSNPVLGEEPPHWYGVPRYCIAIPTTPPCVAGGALVVETPDGEGGGAESLARACASRRRCRAASAAFRRSISLLIEDRRRWRSASCDSMAARRAARSATT